MSATPREGSPAMTRVGVLLVLLVLGVVSLPLVASLLDGPGTENRILSVQLGLMALAGALAGLLVPRLGGSGATRRRGILAGAALGLCCGVLGLALFSLLLNGISGA